jgi:hypothetical protein
MIMEPESNKKKKKRILVTFLKLGILLKACDQSGVKFVLIDADAFTGFTSGWGWGGS